jgi:hypothetical protein
MPLNNIYSTGHRFFPVSSSLFLYDMIFQLNFLEGGETTVSMLLSVH